MRRLALDKEVVDGMIAYCVKCRAKRVMLCPKEVLMKNGKPAYVDLCLVCSTRLFRIAGMK